MKLTSLALLMTLAAALILPQHASACSCDDETPTHETVDLDTARSTYDAIFIGQVVRLRSVGGVRDKGWIRPDDLEASIQVHDVWHGDVPRVVKILTAPNGAACGFSFRAGERYLLFTRRYKGKLRTMMCDPNAQSGAANSLARRFGDALVSYDWPRSHGAQ